MYIKLNFKSNTSWATVFGMIRTILTYNITSVADLTAGATDVNVSGTPVGQILATTSGSQTLGTTITLAGNVAATQYMLVTEATNKSPQTLASGTYVSSVTYNSGPNTTTITLSKSTISTPAGGYYFGNTNFNDKDFFTSAERVKFDAATSEIVRTSAPGVGFSTDFVNPPTPWCYNYTTISDGTFQDIVIQRSISTSNSTKYYTRLRFDGLNLCLTPYTSSMNDTWITSPSAAGVKFDTQPSGSNRLSGNSENIIGWNMPTCTSFFMYITQYSVIVSGKGPTNSLSPTGWLQTTSRGVGIASTNALNLPYIPANNGSFGTFLPPYTNPLGVSNYTMPYPNVHSGTVSAVASYAPTGWPYSANSTYGVKVTITGINTTASPETCLIGYQVVASGVVTNVSPTVTNFYATVYKIDSVSGSAGNFTATVYLIGGQGPSTTTPTSAVLSTSSIAGTILTVGSSVGTIAIGQQVFGSTVLPNTIITGGSGTSWTVNQSQTVASSTLYTAFPATMNTGIASSNSLFAFGGYGTGTPTSGIVAGHILNFYHPAYLNPINVIPEGSRFSSGQTVSNDLLVQTQGSVGGGNWNYYYSRSKGDANAPALYPSTSATLPSINVAHPGPFQAQATTPFFQANTSGDAGLAALHTGKYYYGASAANTVTATSVISGTTLTISAPSGTIPIPCLMTGTTIFPGTVITAQTSGTSGGAGTYTVSVSHPVLASMGSTTYTGASVTATLTPLKQINVDGNFPHNPYNDAVSLYGGQAHFGPAFISEYVPYDASNVVANGHFPILYNGGYTYHGIVPGTSTLSTANLSGSPKSWFGMAAQDFLWGDANIISNSYKVLYLMKATPTTTGTFTGTVANAPVYIGTDARTIERAPLGDYNMGTLTASGTPTTTMPTSNPLASDRPIATVLSDQPAVKFPDSSRNASFGLFPLVWSNSSYNMAGGKLTPDKAGFMLFNGDYNPDDYFTFNTTNYAIWPMADGFTRRIGIAVPKT